MTIDQYAVFGHPIGHSKSPRIHRLFAEQTGQTLAYNAQDVTADRFVAAVTDFFAQGGKGLNCTVPLKELAWRHADHLTERARFGKAVNTLARQVDGSILGDNTDGVGLVRDLTANHGICLTGARILILGAGGATRGIIEPIFAQQPERIVIANRTLNKAEAIASEFAAVGQLSASGFSDLAGRQFDLIINATSASLSGQLPPLPDKLLANGGSCYDLAYGDQPTAFVVWGRANRAQKSLDGLGMLVEQAAEAFHLWRGVRPLTTNIVDLLDRERKTATAR